MISGAGVYFDGATSARKIVTVELGPETLRIRDQNGGALAEWRYADIEHLLAPDAVLRIGLQDPHSLARLEVRDPAFAAALDELAATVDRTGTLQRRGRTKLAILVVAATISLAFVALVALPPIAARLTPLLPYALEQRLGQAVDSQLRASLGSGTAGRPLDCGEAESEKPGRAALEALVRPLEAAAGLPTPLRVGVLRRAAVNAIALPGGQIYLFEGLVAQANTPDELAGIIAHEIGHVARRDGVKSVLETAGLSFLFGMLFGDFVGGGAIVVAARSVIESSYSREAEAAADAFGVALMRAVGADAEALARILDRVANTHGSSPKILLDHPLTTERVAAIRAMATAPSGKPLLDGGQWSALKRICAES